MKKLFILLFVLLNFNVLSQTTFSYYSHNAVMINASTNLVEDQNNNKFKVDITLYNNYTGYIVLEGGAVITLLSMYDQNKKTADWHYRGINGDGIRCNVHLNTALEESKGFVYMRIEFNDYSFYYRLKNTYY